MSVAPQGFDFLPEHDAFFFEQMIAQGIEPQTKGSRDQWTAVSSAFHNQFKTPSLPFNSLVRYVHKLRGHALAGENDQFLANCTSKAQRDAKLASFKNYTDHFDPNAKKAAPKEEKKKTEKKPAAVKQVEATQASPAKEKKVTKKAAAKDADEEAPKEEKKKSATKKTVEKNETESVDGTEKVTKKRSSSSKTDEVTAPSPAKEKKKKDKDMAEETAAKQAEEQKLQSVAASLFGTATVVQDDDGLDAFRSKEDKQKEREFKKQQQEKEKAEKLAQKEKEKAEKAAAKEQEKAEKAAVKAAAKAASASKKRKQISSDQDSEEEDVTNAVKRGRPSTADLINRIVQLEKQVADLMAKQ